MISSARTESPGIIEHRKFERSANSGKGVFIFLDGGDDLFDVGENVDGRPLGVDNLGVELGNDGPGLRVEVGHPLDDGVLGIVEVVPGDREFKSLVG